MSTDATQVPAGYVWLQGDNTLNSTDSRDYGPVPYNLLMGRVLFRVRRSSATAYPRAARSCPRAPICTLSWPGKPLCAVHVQPPCLHLARITTAPGPSRISRLCWLVSGCVLRSSFRWIG